MSARYYTKLAVFIGLLLFICSLYALVHNGALVQQTFHSFVTPPTISDPVITEEPDYKIPPDDQLAQTDENGHLRIYWRYINNLQKLCKNIIRVGSLKDGGKEICVDSDYKPKAPCTVYSFGINYQFDFDRAVNDLFGCHVYCFDPSMKNNSYKVSDRIWFYKFGIGDKNHVNSKGWLIKTLATIRKELGHTNTTIDILKIDVEGDEWNSLPEMISTGALDNVKQISMETHVGRNRPGSGYLWGNRQPKDALTALRTLYDVGFRIIMRERNFWSYFRWPIGYMTNVNEVTMVKI